MTSPQDPERRHPGDGPEPDGPRPLTADEDRGLAALLAEAVGRGPVSTPPEVVARLDGVLAELVTERAGARTPTEPGTAPTPGSVPRTDQESGGTVVRLQARRRRLPRVLLAAAAVVLGGYAVADLASDGSLTGQGLQAGSADSSASGDGGGSGGADGGGSGGGSTDSKELGGLAEGRPMTRLPPVRRDHVAADVRRVVRLFGRTPKPDADRPAPGPGESRLEETVDCPVPRLVDGQRLYQVRYQGAPAGLVVGPARQGSVDVTVYSCRTGGVELSRAVPAP